MGIYRWDGEEELTANRLLGVSRRGAVRRALV
ncbi:MAG: hypothetical protein ACJAVS_001792 [Paracoccaceae bacterium]|jgi:hypothetical protein